MVGIITCRRRSIGWNCGVPGILRIWNMRSIKWSGYRKIRLMLIICGDLKFIPLQANGMCIMLLPTIIWIIINYSYWRIVRQILSKVNSSWKDGSVRIRITIGRSIRMSSNTGENGIWPGPVGSPVGWVPNTNAFISLRWKIPGPWNPTGFYFRSPSSNGNANGSIRMEVKRHIRFMWTNPLSFIKAGKGIRFSSFILPVVPGLVFMR